MKTLSISTSITFSLLVTLSCSWLTQSNGQDDFIKCMNLHSQNTTISNIFYTPNNSSYLSILNTSINNLRFTSPSTPRPLIIVTPVDESQIQAVVLCSRDNGLQIRTRSGGHDYEGLSHTSPIPFIIVDLINLSEITIDVDKKNAWVQAGATIGQLYYEISRRSRTLAFPAGTCPTVGVGGHFSGGGYGTLLRKYSLAADNIIDVRLIDVYGKILDRKSMGEELFWAIRGGGGASFGVITSWKVKLVHVPETVTIFSIVRTLEQNATRLVHRWQYVAPNLPKDLYIGVELRRVNPNQIDDKTTQAIFHGFFLGGTTILLETLDQEFQELGVEREDCNEISWIQSVLSFTGYPLDESPQVLASRIPLLRYYFKAKSDYVQEPIPQYGLKGIWKFLQEKEANMGLVLLTPYGGRMKEISEYSIPFPHRAGNLFKIQYLIYWDKPGTEPSQKRISWIRRLYRFMAPYVSKFPRSAYINYKDLDLGVNNEGNTSYAQASIWGFKYFKNNFNRLVQVKSIVDPQNFFRNEQSIPPLHY